jgi:glycerol-3-phosphate dehydrogenase
MARDVIDAVLGREAALARPSRTADWRLAGAADAAAQTRIAEELGTIAAVAAVGSTAPAQLVARHGTEAPAIVTLGAELDLIRPLVQGRAFLEAEVAWAARQESALSLDDVLARRMRLAMELPDRGESIAPRVAAILGAELGWGESRQALEVQNYLASARREYAVPPPGGREPPKGGEAPVD